jgi:hypothetical protein
MIQVSRRWEESGKNAGMSRGIIVLTHVSNIAGYTAQAGTGWNPGKSAADYIMCDGVLG